jgi:radical SAM superfamily enzyme YgiQ (UPF0313 family)
MIFVNPPAKVNKDIPNIGLAYAATHYNTRVIDLNTMPEPRDRYLEYREDVLGISVRSLTYSEAVRIAETYKAKYLNATVKSISGFLDVLCCYPYLNFEDRIEYSEPFSDSYPFPNYELFDSFPIFQGKWSKGEWNYSIMTSQGCPFQCVFCASRNRKWKARTPANCVEELRQAKEKWGIRSFQIVDDCFNVNKKRAIEFCNLVKPLKLPWFCTNGVRADLFDEDLARAMVSAGCTQLSFGVESADPTILKAIKKGETIEQIGIALDIAKKYFANINTYFIIGLPGSSYEKDLASIKWAVSKGVNGHFSFYSPFDLNVQYDDMFYGEGVTPKSLEYPRDLQERLYNLTRFMRSDSGLSKPERIAGKVYLVLRFAPSKFFPHLFSRLARRYNRWRFGGMS